MVSSRRWLALCLALGPAFVLPSACLRISDDLADEPGGTPAAPTTAAELIDRHVAAIGGAKKLEALTQRTVEARVIFHGDKNCPEGDETCNREDQEGSFTLQNTANGRLYRRMVLGEFVEERGFDGKTGWQLQDGSMLRIDTPQESLASREDALLHWYFGLDKRGIEATLVAPRREDAEGKVTVLDGTTWEAKGGPRKTMWFDRSTGLLREEVVEDGEGEKLRGQTIVYEDYKEIDGVLVPHTIRVINRQGDTKSEIEFRTQRVHHEPIPADKFAIPTLPDPQPKPDQLLQQLETARAEAKESPRDAATQMQLTRLAFAAGHFDEAAAAAKATLAAEPNEPEALLFLTRAQLLEGKLNDALKTIGKAEKAGLKPQAAAQQRAWVHHRRRDYRALADDLDQGGDPVQAGRYRAFVGKPLTASMAGKACVATTDLLVKQPLAIVQVQIGDQKVGAIVDTGASDLILTQSLADKLKVPIQARSRVSEGAPEVGHGQIPSLTIGQLTVQNVPVNVFDDASIADMAGVSADKVQMVLGLGTLMDFQVTIDANAGKFELVAPGGKCKKDRDARRTGGSTPFFVHETHYIYVLGRMNGAEGVYLVNTGMRGADMTANTYAYGHAGIGMPPLRSDEAAMVTVEEFALGDGLTVKNLTAAFGYFEQTGTADQFRLDGMIGLGVIGKTKVTIDYEKQRLYFPKGS